jgi:hypothetical protein
MTDSLREELLWSWSYRSCLQLLVQSETISTKVVSSNRGHGEVYPILHYLIPNTRLVLRIWRKCMSHVWKIPCSQHKNYNLSSSQCATFDWSMMDGCKARLSDPVHQLPLSLWQFKTSVHRPFPNPSFYL